MIYTFAAADAGAAIALVLQPTCPQTSRARRSNGSRDRYASRTRIGQSAKTLGGQETASFVVKAMPDFVDRLLRPYRRVAA